MFEERNYKRNFYSAPQSVTSLVAAFLEPSIIVAVFLAVSEAFEEPILRPDLTLCLLVFALTFPGRNRFKDSLLEAATAAGEQTSPAELGRRLAGVLAGREIRRTLASIERVGARAR